MEAHWRRERVGKYCLGFISGVKMITFKTEKAKEQWPFVNINVKNAVYDMSEFMFKKYGINIVVTETKTTLKEDEALNRVSSSHREGRAIDIRTKDWPTGAVSELKKEFEYLDEEIGAISSKDRKRRFIVDMPHGSGPHLHLQIGRDKLFI